jgi:Rps23 Pro-64 3,4-dihydroxylase Tpa1-like proline 4-hydroxylase
MEIELNDKLDWAALAREFQVNKRIQIRDILKEECAERIWKCLSEETPWRLAYHDGKEPVVLTEDEILAKTAQEIEEMKKGVLTRATSELSYIYRIYPMVEAYLAKDDPDLFLHRVLEFINSEHYLNFIKTVTGVPEIKRGNAHAACYYHNQFLSCHNDLMPGEKRRAACVLNFSKDWKADWGGYMQFYDDDFNIELGLLPRFNALNMFLPPQDHSVSCVTSFAGAPRYTVTTFFEE